MPPCATCLPAGTALLLKLQWPYSHPYLLDLHSSTYQAGKVRAMKEAVKTDPDAHSKAEVEHEIEILKALKARLPAGQP